MSLLTYIRKAREEDINDIYQSHLFAVQFSCKNLYSNEIVNAWVNLLSPNSYIESMKTKELWVIEYKKNIQGFFQLDIDNALLDGLYVHPFVHNHGLGTALLRKAEKIANDENLSFLKLYASLNSVNFYKINGYQDLAKCNLQLNNKVNIESLLMKKNLII